jgi:ribosome-associated protein
MSSPAPSDSSAPRPVEVRATPIALCQFLKFGGLAGSAGEAKQAVAEGRVRVNGAVEARKRRQLQAGDRVECGGRVIIVQHGAGQS